jgi:hypothetical protein
MRGLTTAVAAIVLTASHSAAQATSDAVQNAGDRAWSHSASLFSYFVPDDQDFAQPTLAADRGRFHLEARYNYEALKTGSAWLGYTFSAGERLRMDITPMLGGVFGDLHGIAPGYGLTVGWSKLELYSESEYFFDFADESEDFFYNWSELSISPADAWRAGIAVQRTRAYQTSLDFQRGPFAGMTWKPVDLTAYIFNLGWENPTIVIAVETSF